MKKFNVHTRVRECLYSELSSENRALVDAAKEATRGSYVPYSHFRVGAAVLLDDGSIVSGANQENAAFPSSMCAERTTAYWAGANNPGKRMLKIAIAANTHDLPGNEGRDFADCFQRSPIAPCGACRQALMEYENLHGPMEVILYGADKIYIVESVAQLLPLTFTEF